MDIDEMENLDLDRQKAEAASKFAEAQLMELYAGGLDALGILCFAAAAALLLLAGWRFASYVIAKIKWQRERKRSPDNGKKLY